MAGAEDIEMIGAWAQAGNCIRSVSLWYVDLKVLQCISQSGTAGRYSNSIFSFARSIHMIL